ncbi:MAG: hypothetical protein IJ366_09780 [Clostridia bacterium]|nr:hypothetical protein [Clostridia bacterium]
MAEYIKEELPEPYEQIAETIGVDNTIRLAKIFSGERVYFPKWEAVERPLRNKKILEEFNGYNYRMLARKYGLTVTMIRQIVKPETENKRNEPLFGQMSLLDSE